MARSHHTLEFKAEAVRLVVENGYPPKEVAERLGIARETLYRWVRQSRPKRGTADAEALLEAKREIARLRGELKRTQEERDILKKAAAYFAREPE